MTVDEAFVDPRFERGGEYADSSRGGQGPRRDVERSVRDRYLILAATNDDHFVDPGGITHDGPPGSVAFGSAPLAYRCLHEVALGRRAGSGASTAMHRRRSRSRPRPSIS